MKTAIITGASSGLGREFARQLTDIFPEIECCWLIARREDRLEEIAREMVGVETVCLPLDLCDSMSFTTLQEKLAAEKPEVAILINNAGIGEQKMIDETDDDWMMYVMNTNLGGPMRYIREALKIFLPKNDGVIINISSVNGARPFCGATYTSTKGGLNTLTKNVAMRLIDTNIRCNAVAPGATVTPAHLANKAGEQPGGAEMLKYSGHFVYFPGPECDPMDQAYACLYLASKMGKAVRGQVIQVCNGAFL